MAMCDDATDVVSIKSDITISSDGDTDDMDVASESGSHPFDMRLDNCYRYVIPLRCVSNMSWYLQPLMRAVR